MTQVEMINKLIELGYSALDSRVALQLTNFNFEESKELLCLYATTKSAPYMHIIYELLKITKRLEKLEKMEF